MAGVVDPDLYRNRAEKLALASGELILVKSAENYVEIQYLAGGTITKKLLRATFKSIEDQLKPFSQMIRCHRSYIINMDHVIRLHREYFLSIKNALESN